MKVIIYENQCFNVDDADVSRFEHGARELTPDEIRQYGMLGFEKYVSPVNTVVNADGTVTFTPPDIAREQKEQRRQEILMELDRIDRASARSLRAILTAQAAGTEPAQADVQVLQNYERQAVELRSELATLKG